MRILVPAGIAAALAWVFVTYAHLILPVLGLLVGFLGLGFVMSFTRRETAVGLRPRPLYSNRPRPAPRRRL